jgi:hypothetical protein
MQWPAAFKPESSLVGSQVSSKLVTLHPWGVTAVSCLCKAELSDTEGDEMPVFGMHSNYN